MLVPIKGYKCGYDSTKCSKVFWLISQVPLPLASVGQYTSSQGGSAEDAPLVDAAEATAPNEPAERQIRCAWEANVARSEHLKAAQGAPRGQTEHRVSLQESRKSGFHHPYKRFMQTSQQPFLRRYLVPEMVLRMPKSQWES